MIAKCLFTSDSDGCLKQWDIEQQKLMKDFAQIHSGWIGSIATFLIVEIVINCRFFTKKTEI